jgi:Cft2 family RNA processing exonuclease
VQISFLGGATTVTGSRFLLTTSRARILIDCGMFQGSPNEVIRNRVPLGVDPKDIDAILVTHAHLDHCGLLPVVVRDGFDGPIYLTSASAELVEIVLLDSGRLQEEFAKRHSRWERRHPEAAAAADAKTESQYRDAVEQASEASHASQEEHFPTTVEPDGDAAAAAPVPAGAPESAVSASGATASSAATDAAAADTATAGESEATAAETATEAMQTDRFGAPLPHPENAEEAVRVQPPVVAMDLDAPLYDEDDAKLVPPRFKKARYGSPMDIAPGIQATFYDAGHILGSAIIRLEVRDEDGDEPTKIVFSGDLGRPGTPIIRDPTPMHDADYVVVESTYGGREHDPAEESIRMLTEVVNEVDKAGGVLLIPAFAIGRTQENVWELDRLISAGEIPQLPLYLDSPMASRASDVYRRHPEFYDEETAKLLREGETPLDYPNQTITRDVQDSKAIATAARPYMIVSSNGMLTGGRSVAHLRNLIDDPGATILFVGYQGVGTLGRHLQDGATTVKVDGQIRQVRCRIRSISGFSAHADESELLDWLRNFLGQGRKPRRVFLVHGDPDAQQALEPKVAALGFDVHIPIWREVVTLD